MLLRMLLHHGLGIATTGSTSMLMSHSEADVVEHTVRALVSLILLVKAT
jgi:hypothetical protein